MSYKDILLIGEDYIKTYTSVYDNLQGDYILPAIYFAQHQYLEEVLGTSLVRKLQMLVDNGEINDSENIAYKTLLDDYVTDYLAYTAITDIVVETSFKKDNFGTSRTDDEKQYAVSYDEVFGIRDFYKHKADYLQYRMQRFIIANYTDYPELLEYKTIADLQQNLYSAAGCGIWLGGARNPKNYIADRGDYLKFKYNFPSK